MRKKELCRGSGTTEKCSHCSPRTCGVCGAQMDFIYGPGEQIPNHYPYQKIRVPADEPTPTYAKVSNFWEE